MQNRSPEDSSLNSPNFNSVPELLEYLKHTSNRARWSDTNMEKIKAFVKFKQHVISVSMELDVS